MFKNRTKEHLLGTSDEEDKDPLFYLYSTLIMLLAIF